MTYFGSFPQYIALKNKGPGHSVAVPLADTDVIRSVGYKNMAVVTDKHFSKGGGGIRLAAKLKIVKDDSANHSLPSDLKALINDEKSADVVVEAGGKEFNVHR